MTWLLILGWVAKRGVSFGDIESAFVVEFGIARDFFWPIVAGGIGAWLVSRSLTGHATCDMRRSRQVEKALSESEHQLAVSRAETDEAVMSPFHAAPWDYTGLGG